MAGLYVVYLHNDETLNYNATKYLGRYAVVAKSAEEACQKVHSQYGKPGYHNPALTVWHSYSNEVAKLD